MHYEITLALMLSPGFRDGHPTGSAQYVTIDTSTVKADAVPAAIREALSIAAARFDCQAPDVDPEWFTDPGDEPRRMTWGLDALNGTLVLSSAPLAG